MAGAVGSLADVEAIQIGGFELSQQVQGGHGRLDVEPLELPEEEHDDLVHTIGPQPVELEFWNLLLINHLHEYLVNLENGKNAGF